MEIKHTQTPWKIENVVGDIIHNTDGVCVARKPLHEDNAANWKKDSQFIILACNGYDEMVAALHDAGDVIEAQIVHGEVSQEGWHDMLEKIVAALRKGGAL